MNSRISCQVTRLTVAVYALLELVSAAGTINIDFDFDAAAGRHVGNDGILSNGGTVWNHAFPEPTAYSNFVDEAGVQTSIGMYYDLTSWRAPNWFYGGSPNTLQDGGFSSATSFYIRFTGFDPSKKYNVAIYFSRSGSRVSVYGHNGSFEISSITPTHSLPGTADRDYIIVPNLRPYASGQIRIYASYLYSSYLTGVQFAEVKEGASPEMQAPEMGSGGPVVIHWTSLTNHIYTVHHSTNLVSGFSVLQGNIPGTPPVNSYTGTVNGASLNFWKVSAEE